MKYPIRLAGFEGQQIEVQPPGFWSGPRLLVNGKPPPKDKRGQMVLRRNDGTTALATWRPTLFGLDMPQLVVDGRAISVVKTLQWYEWVWSALPIALIAIGGLLGALIGVIAFSINTRLFRSSLNLVSKFVMTTLVSAICVVIYFIAVEWLYSSLGQ